MPAAIMILFGIGAALLAAVLLVVLAWLISPEWFGKSCSTTTGMLVGMGTTGVIVVIMLCACLGLALAAVVAMTSM